MPIRGSLSVVPKLVAVGLLLSAAARGLWFADYAATAWSYPLSLFTTEPKVVSYADWVRVGASLYPATSDLRYEENWFGPIYFWIVGLTGRAGGGADELYTIGRSISIASCLLAAMLAAARAWRWGIPAVATAFFLSIGSTTTLVFGVMARPDALADFLGFAGFLSATWGGGRKSAAFGGALLAVAALTKQTSLHYAVAALIALWLLRRPRRDIVVVAVTLIGVLSAIVLAASSFEPNLASSLLGERVVPFRWSQFEQILVARVCRPMPDVLVLPVIGIALWTTRAYRDVPLAVLAVVEFAACGVAIMKLGADFNYFLGMRLVAALAGATLVSGLWRETRPAASLGLMAAAVASMALVAHSTRLWSAEGRALWRQNLAWRTASGAERLAQRRQLHDVMRERAERIFTDVEELALYQGESAPFVDAFLFRTRVELGQVNPATLARRIQEHAYQAIILRRDVGNADYGDDASDLPEAVANAIRQAYEPSHLEQDYFVYTPRDATSDEE